MLLSESYIRNVLVVFGQHRSSHIREGCVESCRLFRPISTNRLRHVCLRPRRFDLAMRVFAGAILTFVVEFWQYWRPTRRSLAMISYLMIAIGVLACAVGFWLTFGRTTRKRLDAEDSVETARRARLLFLVYAIDLVLQVYQLEGARQPAAIAIVDAATTSAIFCLLAAYAGALVGSAAPPRSVLVLALGLFAVAFGRALILTIPSFATRSTTLLGLGLLWLVMSLGLALAVAVAQQRRLNAVTSVRASRRAAPANWAKIVGTAAWAIVGVIVLRTASAPFLGPFPSLRAALDAPLVDTLCVVTFVALGAGVGGFGRVVADSSPKQTKTGDEDRRERLLLRGDAILNRDFADPGLTMPRLAAAVGCSEHRFSAALNQGRGINFFSYLNERRIREAQKLISAGRMSMTDIAYACGYNSRSTFYAAFRSVSGLNPAEWRASVDKRDGELSDQADQDTSHKINT